MALVVVGMADLQIAKAPDILTTLGLGSCIGVTLFDQARKIGGLAHIMLPYSAAFSGQNRAKFADTALEDIINLLVRSGAQRTALVAKMAGGAHMFGGSTSNILKVGERNAVACKEVLAKMRIPVLASETGGQHGRTIELDITNGSLKIRTIGHGEKFI